MRGRAGEVNITSDNISRPDATASAEELAAFHVRVWRETYRDLAPQEAWTLLDEARRLPYWQAALASEEVWIGVTRKQGRITGLVAVGPGHGVLQGGGEIRHLYVDPACQGQGIGRLLLTEALEVLRRAGHRRAALAVVEGNHRARAFYARCGGREDLAFTDPGPLWKSANLRVVWTLSPSPPSEAPQGCRRPRPSEG